VLRAIVWVLSIGAAFQLGLVAEASAKKADPTKMTCEEYLSLSESQKPVAAAFLEGWSKGKKQVDIGEVGLDRDVTTLIVSCKETVVTRLITPRPSITAGRNVFTWTAPLTGTPNGDAPSLLNASYTFKAEIEVPQGGAEGMLITQGGRFAGYGFYVLKGKPVFAWNLVDLERIKWQGPEVLTPGKHTLEFDFEYDGLGMGTLAFNNMSGIGRSGAGTLKVDGKAVAEQKMERTIPFILAWDENLDVGSDTGTPVDDADYQVPFAFTGKIDKITLSIDRPKLTPADEKMLMEQAQRSNRASE